MLLDLAQNTLTTIQEANDGESISGTFLADGRDGTLAHTLSQDEDTIRVQRGDEIFHLRCESGDYFDGLALAPARNLAVTSGFRGIMLWRLLKTRTTVFPGTPDEGFVLADALTNRYLRGRAGELMRLDAESGVTLTIRQDGLTPQERTTALTGDLVACLIDPTTCLLVDLGTRTSEVLQLPVVEVSRVVRGCWCRVVRRQGWRAPRLPTRFPNLGAARVRPVHWRDRIQARPDGRRSARRFRRCRQSGQPGRALRELPQAVEGHSVHRLVPGWPAAVRGRIQFVWRAVSRATAPTRRNFPTRTGSATRRFRRTASSSPRPARTGWSGSFESPTARCCVRSRSAASRTPAGSRRTALSLLISRNADRAVLRWTLSSATEIETLLNDWAIDALPPSADAPTGPAADCNRRRSQRAVSRGTTTADQPGCDFHHPALDMNGKGDV